MVALHFHFCPFVRLSRALLLLSFFTMLGQLSFTKMVALGNRSLKSTLLQRESLIFTDRVRVTEPRPMTICPEPDCLNICATIMEGRARVVPVR